MTLPTTSGVRRGCRRRCMGCDPCWICRRSYPASVAITSLGGGSGTGSAGTDLSGWRGCCGYGAGTFVPATPYGQDTTFDNGITLHRTFKSPLIYPTGEVTGLGPACIAWWRFKRTQYRQGSSRNLAGEWVDPVYKLAVARCAGTDADPSEYRENWNPADERTFRVEMLTELDITLGVGGAPFLPLESPTIAASPDSTRIDVYIYERFLGFTWIQGTFAGFTQLTPHGWASYDFHRMQRYSIWLPKPCITTGTFTVPFWGWTTIFNQLNNFVINPGGSPATIAIPPCVASVSSPAYSVELTL